MQQNPTLRPDKLDEEFGQYAEEIAIKRAEEELLVPNQLLSKSTLIERCKEALLKEFQTFRKSQTCGANLIKCALEELGITNPELFTDQVCGNIDRIANLQDLIAQDEKYYKDCMAKGMTLQAFAEVDDATMDVLYKAAKELLKQKRYDDAADVFSFLVGINRTTFAFWLGLAVSEFQRARYKEALALYSYICQAWPESADAYLAASRCYKALNDPVKAVRVLDDGLAALIGHPEYQRWQAIFIEEKNKV